MPVSSTLHSYDRNNMGVLVILLLFASFITHKDNTCHSVEKMPGTRQWMRIRPPGMPYSYTGDIPDEIATFLASHVAWYQGWILPYGQEDREPHTCWLSLQIAAGYFTQFFGCASFLFSRHSHSFTKSIIIYRLKILISTKMNDHQCSNDQNRTVPYIRTEARNRSRAHNITEKKLTPVKTKLSFPCSLIDNPKSDIADSPLHNTHQVKTGSALES